MKLFSSPTSKNPSNFTIFSPTTTPSRYNISTIPFKHIHTHTSQLHCHSLSAHDSSSSLENNKTSSQAFIEDKDKLNEEIRATRKSLEELLVVRRPVMDEEDEERLSPIDQSLSKFAKKLTFFEPQAQRVESREKPLLVNLDLALYKSKVLARNFRYQEAEELLQKCIYNWPEDGRPYVALGKIYNKQSKSNEARAVYEKGCQATQGENAYIWQCWAVLENKMGNIRKARALFDAATVADEKHVAAWHGWAVLELKAGNIKKARNLLGKGLKYCGKNEYIYQTLAMLEAKANRFEQARYLFEQATICNPKSCASWLAWAQVEAQQGNNLVARQIFEKAVQASPKNRFAWHVWGVFETNQGNIDQGRKLFKIGHALNPRDPVLLQSLALLEYKNSTANLARVLFRRASELDPRHQPVWIAWGWMEWKEGNIATARELYQKALSINSASESAARCLQAWGVLEQRAGNLSAARRLFRSSLNMNSQSYVTWMTWASLEEDQGNAARAEEIRDLYFQQRTEVVDDASWVMGVLDFIDPAIDSIKKLLNIDRNSEYKASSSNDISGIKEELVGSSTNLVNASRFDLDSFIRRKLSLDPSSLDIMLERTFQKPVSGNVNHSRIWRSTPRTSKTSTGDPGR